MYGASLQGMGRMQGLNVQNSGEEYVIEQLLKSRKNAVIIDVGANKGQYSSLLISNAGDDNKLDVHLFEPSASNIELLKKEFSVTKPNVSFFFNHCALSDTKGSMTLFTDQEGSDIASLYDLQVSVRPFDTAMATSVEVTTLDDYARSAAISSVDLLKIDVEGAEYDVLKGAASLISNRKIKFIQFEFGTANVSARKFFFDFWQLLSSEYDFYHVVRNGIMPVREYSIDYEVFLTTNYFLALKGEPVNMFHTS